jgi:hypothetical protein
MTLDPGCHAMPATTIENLDGTRTELFDVSTEEAALVALLRETFEQHWAEVVFGPCIQGAVFEGRFRAQPRVTLLDGYLTVEADGDQPWHFHLCVGLNAGTPSLPTPPALAAWRRCGRAAFFRDRDPAGHPSAWGFRMWNGRGEQMLTVFFPNPWIDPERRHYVARADWSRLEPWMGMRHRHAGVAPEPPPPGARRPRTH